MKVRITSIDEADFSQLRVSYRFNDGNSETATVPANITPEALIDLIKGRCQELYGRDRDRKNLKALVNKELDVDVD